MNFGEMGGKGITGNAPLENFAVEASKEIGAGLKLEKNKPSEAGAKEVEQLMKLSIREEIARREITNENYRAVSEDIIKNLGISDNKLENLVKAKVGLRAHLLRGEKRAKHENKSIEQKDPNYDDIEMSKQDAEWMQIVGKLIRESRGNSAEIEGFWREFEIRFNELAKDYPNIRDRQNFIGTKHGILGQVAAEDLCGYIGELMRENKMGDVVVEESTADLDVKKSVDMFILVNISGKTRKIPCQIKVCKFAGGASGDFILKNTITLIDTETKYDYESAGQSEVERDMRKTMRKLQNKALPFSSDEEALLIILPWGMVGESLKSKGSNFIENDGRTSDIMKEFFVEQFGWKVLEDKKLSTLDKSKRSAIISKPKKRRK